MRLIDADAIRLPKGFFEEVHNVPKFYEWLRKQPTIKPKQGRWIPHILDHGKSISFGADCSECGYWFAFRGKDNYCPNCGARMKGEEDDSD